MKKQYFNRINITFNLLVAISLITHFFNPNSLNAQINHAYLDPGTGSMIISAIVGIFATIVLGVKTFWYKIVRIFKPAEKKNSSNTRNQ